MTNNNIYNIYSKQIQFQKLLGNKEIPIDDPELFAHHILSLIVEVGEIAQSDKRWKKNGRNRTYDKVNKLEELSDIFIFVLNVCMFSNFTLDQLLSSVDKKIDINISRFKEAQK